MVCRQRLAYASARQDFDFPLRLGGRRRDAHVNRGMEINLRNTLPQAGDYAKDIVFGEIAALMEPEEIIGRAYSARRKYPARSSRQCAKDHRFDQFAREVVAGQRERCDDRLARNADAWHAIFGGKVEQDIRQNRMHVEIEMAVDMIQVADEFQMKIDLCADFVAQTRADLAVEKVAHSGNDRAFEETARRVDDAFELLEGQHASTAAYGEMKSDVESGIFARDGNRLIARGARDHHARTAQHTLAISSNDARIYLARDAEVVAGDNDGLAD